MKILSIETSCDETAVAVLEVKGKKNPKFVVRQNILASQIETHRPFGGVVPHLAAREHAKNLPILIKAVLRREPKVDLIAVTKGPGLLPSLLVGVKFARELSRKLRKPIIGINHLEGHIYSNWIAPVGETRNSKSEIRNKSKTQISKYQTKNIPFPAICLIVSGGHTQLVLMKGHGRYELLGETRDDAAGEAFDKVARMLELGYPGGPEISKLAEKGNPRAIAFPRPMMFSHDYDFSFSGLKTAVLYYLKGKRVSTNNESRTNIRMADVAASFQKAVVDVLVAKTMRAARKYGVKSVLLAGGVAANKLLRKELEAAVAKIPQVTSHQPSIAYSTDNAVMIAVAGYFKWLQGKKDSRKTLDADANLRLTPSA